VRPSTIYISRGVTITSRRKVRLIPDWRTQLGGGKLRTIQRRKSDGLILKDVVKSGRYPPSISPEFPLGYQATDSESHGRWRSYVPSSLEQVMGASPTDNGGPFFTQRSWVSVVYPQAQTMSGTTDLPDYYWGFPTTETNEYVGPIVAYPPHGIAPPPVSLGNLRAMGSVAIARCKPTNQVADLATFLAELYSDGLPKLFGSTLWKGRVNDARSAGEEYLNVEFGWKPMVSDVQDIMSALTHAQDVLTAYERNSGRPVRRRYDFPVDTTETVTVLSAFKGGDYTPTGGEALDDSTVPACNTIRIRRTTRKVWFSGSFTYHLPTDYNSRNALVSAASKARTLLGLDLTPEVLWNAAPWSWAIDWFSNAGDVISNLSDWSTDGLVLRYGYVMEHCSVVDTYLPSARASLRPGAFVSPVVACTETKRREKATPFGFEVSWDGLSPRQLAITTALGLTRR
jgi:hypothetical protein